MSLICQYCKGQLEWKGLSYKTISHKCEEYDRFCNNNLEFQRLAREILMQEPKEYNKEALKIMVDETWEWIEKELKNGQ